LSFQEQDAGRYHSKHQDNCQGGEISGHKDFQLRSDLLEASDDLKVHHSIVNRNKPFGRWRIETHKKNFTRFLILSKKSNLSLDTNKASLCFEVANEVGSLADALMTFKNNSINLTKIQSIPIIGKPSEYSIHIDVEWKRRKQYDDAMHQVLLQVKNLNVLGEYKKGKIEYK